MVRLGGIDDDRSNSGTIRNNCVQSAFRLPKWFRIIDIIIYRNILVRWIYLFKVRISTKYRRCHSERREVPGIRSLLQGCRNFLLITFRVESRYECRRKQRTQPRGHRSTLAYSSLTNRLASVFEVRSIDVRLRPRLDFE